MYNMNTLESSSRIDLYCALAVTHVRYIRYIRLRTPMGAQKLHKRTLWLPMCSAVAPMAREGTGVIPDNGQGQVFTSSSTYTHVKGASAPLRVPSAALATAPVGAP